VGKAASGDESGRARRIVLHVGVEKTGTTSIQAFCARNADALLTKGVLYPEGFGPQNHMALAAAVGPLDRVKHIGPTEGWRGPEDQARFRAGATRRLRAAARRVRGGTMLLTSEHLSSRLHAPQVAALREMLAPLAEAIDVVIYLRRQDELVLSLHSTYAKSGGTRERAWLETISWLDYDAFLGRWETVFGRDHVTVRRFPVENGALVTDFLEAARLPKVEAAYAPPRLNRSLDARNLRLLTAINARMAAWDERGYMPERAALVRLLEERSTGAPPSMAFAERQALLGRFAASNERVRARYFPESEALFAAPVPGDVAEEAVGFEDAIDLAVELWKARAAPPLNLAERLRRAGGRRWQAVNRRLRARVGLT